MKEIDEPEALFHDLSQLLTGFDRLNPEISKEYYARMLEAYPDHLPELLELYSKLYDSAREPQALVRHLVQNERIFFVAKALTYLWYTSELIPLEAQTAPNKQKKHLAGTAAQYYEGLVWKAMRAHPRGLSGGYFGHWSYKPDN